MIPRALRITASLSLFCIGLFLYFQYGRKYLNLHALKTSRLMVVEYLELHPYAGPAIYIALMSAVIGTNLPGATMLSLSGGVFFAQPFAPLYAYIGYIIGASISYTLVRSVFGDGLRKMVAGRSEMFVRFEEGLNKQQNFWQVVSFLVFVRYIAFFPFWFVNASCALLNVGYKRFLLTTAMATIPGSLIYTWSGELLVDVLEEFDGDSAEGELVRNLLHKTFFESSKGVMLVGLLAFCTLVPVILHYTKTGDGTSVDEAEGEVKKAQ